MKQQKLELSLGIQDLEFDARLCVGFLELRVIFGLMAGANSEDTMVDLTIVAFDWVDWYSRYPAHA